jgi:hypothetical protein
MTADVRILWIDDIVPDARLGCGYPRAQALLKLLASSGFQVTVFPYRADGERREAALTELCRTRLADFDAIWISRPWNFRKAFPVVAAHRRRQPVIYDAEALASVREVARLEVAGTPPDEKNRAAILKAEFFMMRRADAIVSVSVPERDMIARRCGKPTFLMGHVETASPASRGFAQRSDLLFVGSFHSPDGPNTDSMVYFTREILPLVRRQVDCRLHVVGYRSEVLRSEGFLPPDRGVAIHGFAPDLGKVYDRARVMVIPTRYAAGAPSKLAEALAHGLPCVVTPIIASQVPFREPPVLSGANPAEFAAGVVSLYTDQALWTQTRRVGEQFVQAYYTETAVRAQVNALRAWIEGWHGGAAPGFTDRLRAHDAGS